MIRDRKGFQECRVEIPSDSINLNPKGQFFPDSRYMMFTNEMAPLANPYHTIHRHYHSMWPSWVLISILEHLPENILRPLQCVVLRCHQTRVPQTWTTCP